MKFEHPTPGKRTLGDYTTQTQAQASEARQTLTYIYSYAKGKQHTDAQSAKFPRSKNMRSAHVYKRDRCSAFVGRVTVVSFLLLLLEDNMVNVSTRIHTFTFGVDP